MSCKACNTPTTPSGESCSCSDITSMVQYAIQNALSCASDAGVPMDGYCYGSFCLIVRTWYSGEVGKKDDQGRTYADEEFDVGTPKVSFKRARRWVSESIGLIESDSVYVSRFSTSLPASVWSGEPQTPGVEVFFRVGCSLYRMSGRPSCGVSGWTFSLIPARSC